MRASVEHSAVAGSQPPQPLLAVWPSTHRFCAARLGLAARPAAEAGARRPTGLLPSLPLLSLAAAAALEPPSRRDCSGW